MILKDPDTGIEIISEESYLYQEGVRKYHVMLPSWWRKDAITISFDEAEL